MSKFDRVLKTHSNQDNSNDKIARLFKFTPEVTPIGPHIMSKLQPNPTIFGKVIHHFVHGSFFQDHPHRVPLCVKLHWNCSYELLSRPFGFFQDHSLFSIFTAQWQDSSFSSHPHSTGPPRTSKWPTSSGRVTSPSRWKRPISPERDGMQASLVSWALRDSRDGHISTSPKTKKEGKTRRTSSKPSQTL